MTRNAPRGWLISYDIADPRRLARLHRFLTRHATPVQYSVFFFEGSDARMARLMAEIERRIDPGADDVRGYALPAHPKIDTLGRGHLPGETFLFSSTAPGLLALLQAVGKC